MSPRMITHRDQVYQAGQLMSEELREEDVEIDDHELASDGALINAIASNEANLSQPISDPDELARQFKELVYQQIIMAKVVLNLRGMPQEVAFATFPPPVPASPQFPSHDHGVANEHFHDDNHIPASVARDSEVDNKIALHGATGHPIAIHKPTDQAITGTTIVDITGISFPVLANSTYIFHIEVDITASGGTSPTHNYQFTGPTSPDRVSIKRSQMTSATAIATSVVTALATGFGAGATVANTKTVFDGVIKTGANPGTVQLRVTPAGTNPTSTVARGSGGYAVKVA